MSLEKKYKDYFKIKSSEELYEIIAKFKMFIDLTLQESIAGTPDDRIKSMYSSLQKLRDSMVHELSLNGHSKNLKKMEEDLKKFEELNVDTETGEAKKNLSLEQEQENDQ